MIDNNLPVRLGYLSADIEPPQHTFAAMQRMMAQGLSFNCITLEHDNYVGHHGDYDKISHDFLISQGYKGAVTGVYPKENKHMLFETWYVHSDMDFPVMTF